MDKDELEKFKYFYHFCQLWDQQMIHFVILSGVACVLIVAELSRCYL